MLKLNYLRSTTEKIVAICPHSHRTFKQAIRDSAQARKRTSLRVFEGLRLIEDALLNGFSPKELLMTQSMADSRDGERLLRLIHDRNRFSTPPCQPCCVDDGILKSIGETKTTQSVIALFEVPDKGCTIGIEAYFRKRKHVVALSRYQPATLLCDHVSDPGNFGTLLRSSLGFSIQSVIAVGGCDVWVSAHL